MKQITIESIRNGLATKDSWVERAVLVLADDPAVGVLDRRHFTQYRDDLVSFGKIDPIEPARDHCLKFAPQLFKIATSPSYDFKGKTFVMTGRLVKYKRRELTDKLESLGAYIGSSVTRRSDVLICGSKPGSKLQVAERYAIPVWSEDDLLKNLKSPSKK